MTQTTTSEAPGTDKPEADGQHPCQVCNCPDLIDSGSIGVCQREGCGHRDHDHKL